MKHNFLMRVLAFVLAFVMMLEIGPMQVFATEAEIPGLAEPPVTAEPPVATEPPEVFIEGEVVELRSEYEKHYRLTDGSFMAVQFQVPVHYEDDGQWVDIDNTLQSVRMFDGTDLYVSEDGRIGFAADLSDGSIMTMDHNGHMISMSLWSEDDGASSEDTLDEAGMSAIAEDMDAMADDLNEDVVEAQILTDENATEETAATEEPALRSLDDFMPDTLGSSVLYENVFPGVDLRYDTFSYNVKESIILKQRQDQDTYSYTFLLTLDGLEPELQDDGSILLLDDWGEVQYTIPAPYMWDSNGSESDAVAYTLEDTVDGWLLTIEADEAWLEAEDRAYPVTIDPSVEKKNTALLFTSAVSTGTPTSSSSYVRTKMTTCGIATGFGEVIGYVKLQTLPDLPVGSIVTEATFKTDRHSNAQSVNKKLRVDVLAVIEAIPAGKWDTYLSWSEVPATDSLAMDFVMLTSSYSEPFDPDAWDITPAVMRWYEDASTNHGLAFVPALEAAHTHSYIRFDPAQSVLTITYRSTIGIEDHYTYETQSAGRAGTGYVGDYSSNLTVIKSDVSYPSETLAFSVGHVFNSALRNHELDYFKSDLLTPDYSKMNMGWGWQLSVQESVGETEINEDSYLVYRDGDGTTHYFKETSSGSKTYKDEDGLGLTITKGSSGGIPTYMMKDQTENERYFYAGYLKYIKDNSGNKICFLYNDAVYTDTHSTWNPPAKEAVLTSIVAARNEQTPKTICTFTYSSNRLTKITDFAGRITSYEYIGENLERIIHPDGTVAHYDYSDKGDLLRMYDAEAGYGIEYTYDNNGNVTGIHEYTASSISGTQTVGVQIQRAKTGLQETTYRYDGDDRTFNTEDDIVNYYSFDYTGRTINALTLDSDMDTILGVTAAAYTTPASETDSAKNKIEKTAQSGQNGVNLLTAGGVETHNGYTPSSADWVKTETTSSFNAVIKNNEEARTGVSSLKTWIGFDATANAGAHKRIAIYQTVNLEAGKTYTVSAYVNTQGIVQFDNGGVYVAIMDTGNRVLSSGDMITYKTSPQIEDGWQRVYATFDCDTTGDYRIAAIQDDAIGHTYFDDLQLEEGNVPSNANLLQNGSFANDTSEWTNGNYRRYYNTEDTLHPSSLRVTGDPDDYLRASQRIMIGETCTDQTFLLSGWGKAASAAGCETNMGWSWADGHIPDDHDSRYFGLIAVARYKETDSDIEHDEHFYMPFNDDYDDWQFASCVIVPGKDYQDENMILKYIDVYVVYDNNFNTMSVDNLSLRKEPCITYTYPNSDNKNTSTVVATGISGGSVQYKSDKVRPETVWKTETEVYTYEYADTNNKYLPTTITNYLSHVYTEYTYDKYGNSILSKVGKKFEGGALDNSVPLIQSSTVYSADGSQVVSETNGNGQTTTYQYNAYRNLRATTDGNKTIVYNTYNDNNDRSLSSFIRGIVSVDYAYSNGLLNRITRGGYITSGGAKQNQYYNMSYDSFGNMTEVSIGSDAEGGCVLASYEYGAQNNHLDSMSYGNGDAIYYEYDELDRVVEESWVGGSSYQYFYNSEGDLAKKVDMDTGNAVNYQYDSLGRLIHSSLSDPDGISMRTEHQYDRQGRLKQQSWQLRGADGAMTTYTDTYAYRGSDGAIKTLTPAIGKAVAFAYDAIARLENQSNDVYAKSYTYHDISDTQTTTQIEKLSYAADGSSFVPFTLTYAYDAVGNIISISCPQLNNQNTTYTYDIQGQMTQETTYLGTYNYTYDTYGNIRSVSGSANHTYTYGDSEWKDLLTAYDGEEIEYDAIGNPESYYNGTRWEFDWENGRQLASADSSDHAIAYTYDMAGIRDSKTVDGVTYNYLTLSGKVMRQTWTEGTTTHTIDFTYDNAGNPYAFKYDGTVYYYVLNQQGDVLRIVDTNGVTQAQYTYNAWGKLIGSSDTPITRINPLRYRGYYYDTETGFYYLQSRYYDPSIGRFINADSFASTGQGFIGYNMFAYCTNNPVMFSDHSGFAATFSNLVYICDGGYGTEDSFIFGGKSVSYGGETWEKESFYRKSSYLDIAYLQVCDSEFSVFAMEASLLEGGYHFNNCTITPFKLWNVSAEMNIDLRSSKHLSIEAVASIVDIEGNITLPYKGWNITLYGTIHVVGAGVGLKTNVKKDNRYRIEITPAFIGWGYTIGVDFEKQG